MKKWLIVGVTLAVLAGVVVWLTLPDEADDIADTFDLNNAPFYLQDTGMPTELVSLSDGVYETDDVHVEVVEGPVYSDLDGDGKRDAAAILQVSGEENWRGVFAWLDNGDETTAVPWMLSWQYDCVTDRERQAFPLEGLMRAGLTLVAYGSVDYGVAFTRNLDNRCEDLNLGAGSIGIGADAFLHENVPVTVGWVRNPVDPTAPTDEPYSAATTECTRALSVDNSSIVRQGFRPIAPDADLLLVPEDGAPEVVSPLEVEGVYVWAPEDPDPELLRLRNGYVPAEVYWAGPPTDSTCAWVKWDQVEQR